MDIDSSEYRPAAERIEETKERVSRDLEWLSEFSGNAWITETEDHAEFERLSREMVALLRRAYFIPR